MFESSQNVLLKPTESWRATLLDGRVMELFFTVSLASSQREGRGTGFVAPSGRVDGRPCPAKAPSSGRRCCSDGSCGHARAGA